VPFKKAAMILCILTIVLHLTASKAIGVIFNKYITEEGKIKNEFWTQRRKQCAFFKEEIKHSSQQRRDVFRKVGLSKLVFDAISAEENMRGGQRFLKSMMSLMSALGDTTQDGINIQYLRIDERYFQFLLNDKYYLLDQEKDTAYHLMDTSFGKMIHSVARIEKVDKTDGYKNISNDTKRIFFKTSFENGRLTGYPGMSVFDIDFEKGVFLGVFEGNLFEDLDHDGRAELIVQDEVAWNLNWFWVFKWEDGCWIDESRIFPKYYITTVTKYLEGLAINGSVPDKAILNILLQAAKNGGPCCQSQENEH